MACTSGIKLVALTFATLAFATSIHVDTFPSKDLNSLPFVPDLGFSWSHTYEIGNSSLPPDDTLLEIGGRDGYRVPGLKLNCVDCRASGKIKITLNARFGKTPEMDRAIEDAHAVKGEHGAIQARSEAIRAGSKCDVPGYDKCVTIHFPKNPVPTFTEGLRTIWLTGKTTSPSFDVSTKTVNASTLHNHTLSHTPLSTAVASSFGTLQTSQATTLVAKLLSTSRHSGTQRSNPITTSSSWPNKISSSRQHSQSASPSTTSSRKAQATKGHKADDQKHHHADDQKHHHEDDRKHHHGTDQKHHHQSDKSDSHNRHKDDLDDHNAIEFNDFGGIFGALVGNVQLIGHPALDSAAAMEQASSPTATFRFRSMNEAGATIEHTLQIAKITNFAEVDQAVLDVLKNWRFHPNLALRAAMQSKGNMMALSALDLADPAGTPPPLEGPIEEGLPEEGPAEQAPDEEGEEEEPPEDDCPMGLGAIDTAVSAGGAFPLLAREIMHGRSSNDNDTPRVSTGDPFGKLTPWMREHASELTLSFEAVEDIHSALQLKIAAKEDFTLAYSIDWFGSNRYGTSASIAWKSQDSTAIDIKPAAWQTDQSGGFRSPMSWITAKEATSKKIQSKLGDIAIDISLLNIRLAIGGKADLSTTLPGYSAKIHKGSRYEVDILRGAVLENTLKPEVVFTPLEVDGDNPELYFQVDVGPAIKAKLIPGLKIPKKSKKAKKADPDACKETFENNLAHFLVQAKGYAKMALDVLKDKALAKLFETMNNYGADDNNVAPRTARARRGSNTLNLANLKKWGFSDPLSIGGKFSAVRLDYKIAGGKAAGEACDAPDAVKESLIFRTGFTPYISFFAWRIDTSWAPKIDKSTDATTGLFKSKALWKKCTSTTDAPGSVLDTKNRTVARIGWRHVGSRVMNANSQPVPLANLSMGTDLDPGYTSASGDEILDMLSFVDFAKENERSANSSAPVMVMQFQEVNM